MDFKHTNNGRIINLNKPVKINNSTLDIQSNNGIISSGIWNANYKSCGTIFVK